MDAILLLDITACAFICIGCGVVIMHPRIHEGLVLRVGLVLLSLGSFGLGVNLAMNAENQPLRHALSLCLGGVVIIGLGIARRLYADPHMRELAQRVSGWGDLDASPDT